MTTTVTIPAVNPGTDLKFRVITTKDDFSLDADQFVIVVKNQYGRVTHRVLKSDCYLDSEGQWYFNVEHVAVGLHYAVFVGVITDGDYTKMNRNWTDIQPMFLGTNDCKKCRYCCENDHPVSYEQVWTINIDDGEYLSGADGKFVLTSDGKRIGFKDDKNAPSAGKVVLETLTAEQFKQLIEGRSQDGKTDTIPEIIDVMQGINNEETTIKGDVDEQISENNESVIMKTDRVTPEDIAGFEV